MQKTELPRKTCPECQRPFSWRKKWQRCWDDVKYCSQRCRQQAHRYRKSKALAS